MEGLLLVPGLIIMEEPLEPEGGLLELVGEEGRVARVDEGLV